MIFGARRWSRRRVNVRTIARADPFAVFADRGEGHGTVGVAQHVGSIGNVERVPTAQLVSLTTGFRMAKMLAVMKVIVRSPDFTLMLMKLSSCRASDSRRW
jgi:hypothetical protein